jgi:hypothetical protein
VFNQALATMAGDEVLAASKSWCWLEIWLEIISDDFRMPQKIPN